MRVLHLTTHLNTGGITNYVLRLAKPLARLGCEISVASSGGVVADSFRQQGLRVFTLPIRTKSELHPKIYAAIPRVLEIVREHRIDLLHAHTRVTQVMAFWIRQIGRILTVTTCHGFYKRRLGRRILPAWGDRTIAISEPVQDHLLRDFGVAPERIHLIHNGVDLEEIDDLCSRLDPKEEKRQFGFREEHFVVGVVARLVPDKGHEYLIRAIAALREKFPQIRLLIVGSGHHQSHLESLAASLRLNHRVVFTGDLDNVRVLGALSSMDVFAMPATWREGFGLSLVEAMACRKPVVVTNIWSLNALIQNERTGILIEPKEVEPLAEALRKLMVDDALRERIATEARKMVEKQFSITQMATRTYDLYEKLLMQPDANLTVPRPCL